MNPLLSRNRQGNVAAGRRGLEVNSGESRVGSGHVMAPGDLDYEKSGHNNCDCEKKNTSSDDLRLKESHDLGPLLLVSFQLRMSTLSAHTFADS